MTTSTKLAALAATLALAVGMARLGPKDPVHVLRVIPDLGTGSFVDNLNAMGAQGLQFVCLASSAPHNSAAWFLDTGRKLEYRLVHGNEPYKPGLERVKAEGPHLADLAATKDRPAEWRSNAEWKIVVEEAEALLAAMADDGRTSSSPGWRLCGTTSGSMIFCR